MTFQDSYADTVKNNSHNVVHQKINVVVHHFLP